MRETHSRVPGSRRIPLHDHSDLNSGGKLRVSQAIQGGLNTIIGSVPPSTNGAVAGSVTVIDAADYYAGTNVEDILQEIGLILSGHVEVVAASGASVDLDYDTARYWDITLTDDCTFTFSNPPDDQTWGQLVVVLRQGTGAPYTVTWPAEAQWPDTDGTAGGSPPTLFTTEDAIDVVTFVTVDGGTSWGGNHGSGGSSLTVENEGAPLATAATTLDFVGDGVTASGTGAEKTITISGAPTGAAGGDLSGTYPNPSVVDDSHAHTATTLPGMAAHAHVVSEVHLSNGSGTTYTLDQAFEPGSVVAWNTTSLARLGVTETEPDQATVSAAGSSGDSILFDYAATVV